MRKPLVVMSLRRKKRLGGPLRPLRMAVSPRQASPLSEKPAMASRRRLAASRGFLLLIIFLLILSFILYRAGYLSVGLDGIHQSRLVRGVKLFIASKLDSEQAEALRFVQQALEQRTALLPGGDFEAIKANYDLECPSGEWAYENEVKRAAYLRKWAEARNVRMVEAISTFEVDSVNKEGEGCYWIEITEHTRYAYEYPERELLEPTWAVSWKMSWAMGAGLTPNPVTPNSGTPDPDTLSPGTPDPAPGPFSAAVSDVGMSWDYHEFGSRTVHVIEVMKADGEWKIRKDWYMDPLGNNVFEPGQGAGAVGLLSGAGQWMGETGAAVPGHYDTGSRFDVVGQIWAGSPFDAASGIDMANRFGAANQGDVTSQYDRGSHLHAASQIDGESQFDREKALKYAVKHSGVRALPEGGKYNPKYKIYTFTGGDCANFASQVLHAGGIPMGGGWHYTKEGSTAWVQSESLVWHLLSSGMGRRLFRGTFSEAGSGIHPDSVASQLEPGDVIAYEIKGQLYHVAVVAGRDPRGYITIVSHTADRLYFPWDLGWDDSTVFWFIKITY